MNNLDVFPNTPKNIVEDIDKWIYAYKLLSNIDDEYIKIGETKKDPIKRINQQLIKSPHKHYKMLRTWNAKTINNNYISDKDIHYVLNARGFKHFGEFYKVKLKTIESIIIQLISGIPKESIKIELKCTENFSLRREQREAINITKASFNKKNTKFLWNAKMRFGKTFTSYKLIEELGFKKILMITYKPSIMKSWIDDLRAHIDFVGWGYKYKSKYKSYYVEAEKGKPTIIFKSFQDVRGRTNNKIKEHNLELYKKLFDLVILDEYHFGSWNENSKNEFAKEYRKLDEYTKWLNDETNEVNAIKTKFKLFLSGTPFKILEKGEFSDDQVFTWSYTDEQKEKNKKININNVQYQSLPKMVIMAYTLPENITDIYLDAETEDFSLNHFFATKNNEFINKDDVAEFLRWISGHGYNKIDKIPKPFFDMRLQNYLNHTFWMLPSVAAVYAMKNIIESGVAPILKDYHIVIAADSKKKNGYNAYLEVSDAVDKYKKTITLSAGMLNTGTTIKKWKGVFMLSDIKSPETYFQTAFRAQSPYVEKNIKNNEITIMKDKCYLFDFSPFRSFRMVYQQVNSYIELHKTREEKMQETLNVLPVLSMDGVGMRKLNAEEIIELAIAKTSGTLLARKWESPMLVNVTNAIITNILNNQEILNAIMKIKGFRSINRDFELIINKTNKIKEAKSKERITLFDKKQINKNKKEIQTKRKQIRDKLIKFASRIPIFMYLTDTREETLEDLIVTYEPKLFNIVTGLTTKDFELLKKVGLFNVENMDEAVWSFRRFEDDSFHYIDGISKRNDEKVIGGFISTIGKKELLK